MLIGSTECHSAERPGARTALALADGTGRFLSAVQIGIPLVSILAGAFSDAAPSERRQDVLAASCEAVETCGVWVEVRDLDGRRIDNVLAGLVEPQNSEVLVL